MNCNDIYNVEVGDYIAKVPSYSGRIKNLYGKYVIGVKIGKVLAVHPDNDRMIVTYDNNTETEESMSGKVWLGQKTKE